MQVLELASAQVQQSARKSASAESVAVEEEVDQVPTVSRLPHFLLPLILASPSHHSCLQSEPRIDYEESETECCWHSEVSMVVVEVELAAVLVYLVCSVAASAPQPRVSQEVRHHRKDGPEWHHLI